MTKIEKPEYFKKYLDKNGEYISLGDVVFGEDGKAFEVEAVEYTKGVTHPIKAREMRPTYRQTYLNPQIALKPKWLTHNPTTAWQNAFMELLAQVKEARRKVQTTKQYAQGIPWTDAYNCLTRIVNNAEVKKNDLKKGDTTF